MPEQGVESLPGVSSAAPPGGELFAGAVSRPGFDRSVLLPVIEVEGRQLRHVTADALAALARGNDPPRLFRQGGALVRLQIDASTNRVSLARLTGKVLRYELARAANWFREGEPVPPPPAVVGDVEATADLPDVPALDAVVHCPVLTAEGEIITQAGYHPSARLWYQPDDDLGELDVPHFPSAAQVREARALIEENLLVDFPFVAACDRAVAWAALVLPFARPAIDGPTPLHLLRAPTRGTGKTLLAEALMVPALGRRKLEAMVVDCAEAEMRKRLTATLRDAPAVVLLDNLGQGRRLESSSLAAVLTAGVWADRLLGVSVRAALPVRCVWLATGNNPILSDEHIRRTVSCCLDTGQARPHLRSGFKHRDLLDWARAHRPLLVRSILTLVRAWLAAGQPEADLQLGRYESWCRVVGGILQAAGVNGLREAIASFQGAATDSEQAVAPFLQAWWARFGAARVGVKELYDLAVTTGCLEELLDVHLPSRPRARGGAETERGKQTRLGLALRRLSGQVHGGHQIQADGTDHSGRQTYRLQAPPDQPLA